MLIYWQAWALLSALFAAATAVLAKGALADLAPEPALWLRTIVVVLLLTAAMPLVGGFQNLHRLPRGPVLLLTLSGAATAASWYCYFRALKEGPVSLVAVIDKLSIPLVALFAATVLGEKLQWRGWCGVALMAAGACLAAWRR